MIHDYLEIRNAEGMPKLIDANMSLAFLLNSKNSIRNLCIALSETASPEVRKTLRDQLNKAINLHEEISEMMIAKGWFHPVELDRQFRMDVESSATMSQIAAMDLFPGDTSRLGTFATPEK
jgi:spore coat protein CotF